MNYEETVSHAGTTTHQQDKSTQQSENLNSRSMQLQKPRKGTIVRGYQLVGESGEDRIYIDIRFDDGLSDITQSSHSKRFTLDLLPTSLSLLYGTLEDLIGLRVLVLASGNRKSQGIATIINEFGRGNLQKASKLKPFGTLLAPAGNGI
jgi:hypothetical protein